MENIYKKMWEDFKEKYGEEYIVFEGGDNVNTAMEEIEKKCLEELKEHNKYKPFEDAYKGKTSL